MNEPRRQIPEDRKQLYYFGGVMQILGLILFRR
jgi:hypothetical protein